MNKAPEPDRLIDAVLAEDAGASAPLDAILSAVRARRNRRRRAPAAIVVAVVLLGFAVLNPSRRGPETTLTAPTVAARLLNPVAPELIHIASLPLTGGESMSTPVSVGGWTLVHSDRAPTVRATDAELLELAGGNGVGLIRIDGRVELFLADVPPPR